MGKILYLECQDIVFYFLLRWFHCGQMQACSFVMPRVLEYVHPVTCFCRNGEMKELCLDREKIGSNRAFCAYLEACRQERGQKTSEILQNFLTECQSTAYNGHSRYTDYVNAPTEEMRGLYNQYDLSTLVLSVEEQNWLITKERVADGRREQIIMSTDTDTNGLSESQESQVQRFADTFMNQLKKDIQGGE